MEFLFLVSDKEIQKQFSEFLDSWSRFKSLTLYVLLATAALLMCGAFFGVAKPDHEASAIWFQRGGSIAVFIAIFSEYKSQTSFRVLSGVEPMDMQAWKRNYLYIFNKLKVLSLLVGLIGTIVWGYGDLIYVAIT